MCVCHATLRASFVFSCLAELPLKALAGQNGVRKHLLEDAGQWLGPGSVTALSLGKERQQIIIVIIATIQGDSAFRN